METSNLFQVISLARENSREIRSSYGPLALFMAKGNTNVTVAVWSIPTVEAEIRCLWVISNFIARNIRYNSS